MTTSGQKIIPWNGMEYGVRKNWRNRMKSDKNLWNGMTRFVMELKFLVFSITGDDYVKDENFKLISTSTSEVL